MVHVCRIHTHIGYVVLIFPTYLYSAELNQQASRSFAAQSRSSIIEQHRVIITSYQQHIDTFTKQKHELVKKIDEAKKNRVLWAEEFRRYDRTISFIEERINEADSKITNLKDQDEDRRMRILVLAERNNRLLFRKRLLFTLKPIIKSIEINCSDAINFVASGDLDSASAAIQKTSDTLSDTLIKKAPITVVNRCFNTYLVAEDIWCIAAGKKFDSSGISSNASKAILSLIQRNELSQARLHMADLRLIIEPHQKKFFRQQPFITQLMSHLNNAWSIQALINDERSNDESEGSHPERAAPLVLHEPIEDPIDPAEIEIETMCRDFYTHELTLLARRKAYYAKKLSLYASLKQQLNDTQQHIDDLQALLPNPPMPPRALSPEDGTLMPVVRSVLRAIPAPSLPPKQTKPRSTQPGILPPLVQPVRSIDLGKPTPAIDIKPPRQPHKPRVFTFERPINTTEALRSKHE